MACDTCSAIGRIVKSRKSSQMKGSSFQKKAIGGGIALVLEYLVMDKVVTTKRMAFAQAGVGALGFFFSKNPIIKTAGLGVGVLGAAKAATGKNVLTQAAISGINPLYKISGTNPYYNTNQGGENSFM